MKNIRFNSLTSPHTLKHITDLDPDALTYKNQNVINIYHNNLSFWPSTPLTLPATPASTQFATPQPGPLLFSADFTKGLSQYKNLHPTSLVPERDIGLSKDPTGTGELVVWMDSGAGLTHGNNSPRASLEGATPFFATAHQNTRSIYACHISIYFPSSSAFSTTSHWTAFHGVHGAPWDTGSATGLMVVYNPNTKNHYLRMGDKPAFLREQDTIIPLDQWVSLIVYFQYDYADKGGFQALFMNTSNPHNLSSNWRQVRVNNQLIFSNDVISDTEGSGWHNNQTIPPATPRIGTYGNYPLRIYMKNHRIGRTLASVLPGSWDNRVDNLPFTEITQTNTKRL